MVSSSIQSLLFVRSRCASWEIQHMCPTQILRVLSTTKPLLYFWHCVLRDGEPNQILRGHRTVISSSLFRCQLLHFETGAQGWSFRFPMSCYVSGVENRGEISHFLIYCKMSGERWAKYVSEFYEFGLRSNLWYTFHGRLSVVWETSDV